MNVLAETIISLLLEDRVEDLILRYPTMKLNRMKLEKWFEFDPTDNKKYFPWIVKQVSLKKVLLPRGGERLRDDLMRFERLLLLPGFTEPRDINRYDAKTLSKTVRKTANLQSKSEKEREARFKNVKVVGKAGNIVVVEIKNAQELMNRSWQAYSKGNPNWDGESLAPPRVGQEANRPWDGLWCVRFPQFARSYLAEGPFYMVYKNGGIYVGIVFEKGECQTLENDPIPLSVAEEIYPAMKPLIDHKSKNGAGLVRNCAVFSNMRFLRGEAMDGETISGQGGKLDLSWSSLTRLPNSLTVNGTLDLTGCKISNLPAGLTVSGGVLRIAGTPVTALPLDLNVEEMEWSEPLPVEEVKKLLYRMRNSCMKQHFLDRTIFKKEKDVNGVETHKLDASGKTIPLTDAEKEVMWIEFQPELLKYFLTHPKMDASVKSVYHYVSVDSLTQRRGDE